MPKGVMISVEDAAIAAEKAYRRGVQQGVTFAAEGVKLRDLWHWRFQMPTDKATPPEAGHPPISGVETAIARFLCENREIAERYRITE